MWCQNEREDCLLGRQRVWADQRSDWHLEYAGRRHGHRDFVLDHCGWPCALFGCGDAPQ